MQCSKCSTVVKPIVCVDVDGTISEYHNSLQEHCRKYFDLPWQLGEWDGHGNFEDYIGITQAQYREAKLAYRQGGFKRWSPVQDGATELLDTLIELRTHDLVEVWITTTRPWNRLDSVDPDTRFWLDKNFPVYDHILYHDYKYQELATHVDPSRVVGVIDDLPEQVAQASWVFDTDGIFLVPRPHNLTAHPSVPRATLEDFSWTIQERIHEWWTK